MNCLKLLMFAFVILISYSELLYSAPEESDPQAAEIVVKTDPASVIVKINDVAITEGELDAAIDAQIASRPELKNNKDLYSRYKKSLRRRTLNNLINTTLLSQAAKTENIVVTEKDIENNLEQIVQLAMKQTKKSREELAEDIKQKQGMTIEESLNQYRNNKQFQDRILLEKLLDTKFSDDAKVSDAEIKEYYEKNKEARYTKQATVTASHILVMTLDENRKPLDEAKVKEAKAKIEQIQRKLSEPGADFGALAKKYSDCPSKERNGELEPFPRHGAMVEPFAKAAFELEVGQVSDIVETKFGYHLIKVTGKEDGKVTSLDEVKDDIASQLASIKKQTVLTEYVKQLREKANIVYVSKKDDPEEIMKKQQELEKKSLDAEK